MLEAELGDLPPTRHNRCIGTGWAAVTAGRVAVLAWASAIVLSGGLAARHDAGRCDASSLAALLVAEWLVMAAALGAQGVCCGFQVALVMCCCRCRPLADTGTSAAAADVTAEPSTAVVVVGEHVDTGGAKETQPA